MIDLASGPTNRQIMGRTVIGLLLDRGPLSRAELARVTGLSKQTMSELFRDLMAGCWVRSTGRTQGAVGRSAVTYEACADRALVFGADVGGTKIQAAVADMNGAILSEAIEPTDPRGGAFVVAQLAGMNETLCRDVGMPGGRVLVGSVGMPGAFDASSGTLAIVPNIAGLEGSAFAADLSALVDFDVHVDNDVNMAAKGERWLGEGRDIDDFVFIALGTGIGMGIIAGGRVLRGSRGAAGEIAYLPIGASPFDSRNGRSGTLETMLGSEAIRERYEGWGGEAASTVRDIVDRMGAGDAMASALIDEVARTLAEAILAICAVLDPQRVVLGGSIGARAELLERVRHHLPRCMSVPPECRISRLGSRAGLFGTISNSLDHLREGLFQRHGSTMPAPQPRHAVAAQ